MTALRSLVVLACAASLVACERDTAGTPFSPDPLASVRFVNAVADTSALDYRFVDIVTNAGMYNATFRTNQAYYSPLLAGSRTLRVFLSSIDPAIASTVVTENTFNFQAGKQYSVIHAGYLRAGQVPAAALSIVEDAPTAPAAGKVGLRVVNLGAGLGAVDVYVGTTTTGLPAATPTWTNVAFGAFTAYVERDTAALRVTATAAGGTTPLFTSVVAPAGADTSGVSSQIAGVRRSGSVLTIVVLPRSVAGSSAPTSFTTPTAVFLADRRPSAN